MVIEPPVAGMKNPSAVYCGALGYQYNNTVNPDGSMTGYCILPDNRSVVAWQFFRGDVAQDASYCTLQGYQIRTVKDRSVCEKDSLIGDTCAVCIMKNGTTVEVGTLMNLNYSEKVYTENSTCNPDTDSTCTPAGTQPGVPFNFPVVLLIIIIILAAGSAFFVIKRKKSLETAKKEK